MKKSMLMFQELEIIKMKYLPMMKQLVRLFRVIQQGKGCGFQFLIAENDQETGVCLFFSVELNILHSIFPILYGWDSFVIYFSDSREKYGRKKH